MATIDKFTLPPGGHRAWCCCPFTDPEAVGYVLHSVTSGFIIMSNIFFQAAVLELAERDAGCGWRYRLEDDPDYTDDPDDCKGTTHGMRPANIYNTIATAAAFGVALLLPLVGVIVEHTSYRKELALLGMVFAAFIQIVQGFVNRDNWFTMTVLQVFAITAYYNTGFAVAAYVPELSTLQDELNKIGAFSSMSLFTTEVLYVIVINVIGSALYGGHLHSTIKIARFSQLFCGIGLFFIIAVVHGRYLRTRPKEILPCGEVVRRGLSDLKKLCKQTYTDHPDLFRYLIGISFANSAMSSFATVSGVFLIVQLKATVIQFSIVVLSLLIVGALMTPFVTATSHYVAKTYGDAVSASRPLIAALAYIGIATAIAPAFMRGPKDLWIVYIFGLVWGVGFGFYYALYYPCYFFLVPTGQEAKLSALLQLFLNVLGWAPLLAFTVIYNLTGGLSLGLVAVAAFLFVGCIIIATSVDMERGRKAAIDHGINPPTTDDVEESQPKSSGGVVELSNVTETDI